MNLKELTWKNHKKAERKEFASVLMSGNISVPLYYSYLYNQYHMYSVLESALAQRGFPAMMYDVFRTTAIREDMAELEHDYGMLPEKTKLYPLVADYHEHILNLERERDYDGLVAHMYVRHFGDMYGGSMIAKKVPGAGRMYEFNDKENLKAKLRELLNDDMAKEANICFEYAIKLFEELGKDVSSME